MFVIYVLSYLCRTIALVANVICWPYPALNESYLIFYLLLYLYLYLYLYHNPNPNPNPNPYPNPNLNLNLMSSHLILWHII